MRIDFSEFSRLWAGLHGEEEAGLRAEFARFDLDNSGYITKEELLEVISAELQGNKVTQHSILDCLYSATLDRRWSSRETRWICWMWTRTGRFPTRSSSSSLSTSSEEIPGCQHHLTPALSLSCKSK